MTAALPISDVSAIAAVLGVFFLLVAFYKSIFHRRRRPSDALTHGNKTTSTADDNQSIQVSDPFKQPDTAPILAQPEPELNNYVTAFRQFTPNREGGDTEDSKNDSPYVWE